MHGHRARLFAAIVVAVLLAVCVGTASANRLSFSTRNFRTTWTSLEFRTSEGTTTVRCAVTMEGSYHSATISKVAESLVGYITRVAVRRPCTGGTVWAMNGDANEVLGGNVRNTLPWHVLYDSFTGTLPNIRGAVFEIPEASYLIRESTFGLLCEYIGRSRSSRAGILFYEWWIEAGGRGWWRYFVVGFKASGTTGCPEIEVRGEGSATALGTTVTATLRLI
jgi:hypothetical protein